MIRRLRTSSFAGIGAVLLALIVSGMVAAASILTAVAAPEPDQVGPAVVDTTGTFEDVNGDGIDDDCQAAVVANDAAAAAAQAAADLNGDGTISVSEAAQSDRVGGKNCNHGGYVSGVAHGSCGAGGVSEPASAPESAPVSAPAPAPGSDCSTEDASTDSPTQDQPPTCDTAPTGDNTSTNTTDTTDTPKNHGEVVSKVAQSGAVGGKNCNHGGAVSDASHKDNEARKAARDAAKEAAKAARDAAKAARDAAKAQKHAGKGHGHNH
jgi:hypothetical protein